MYLRTPKRYQANHRRRHLFSLRWLWLWVLTLIVVVGGWVIYQNADQLGPPVREFVSNAVDNARGGISTMTAPTPLPTTNPSDRITRGDNAWSQGAIEQAISEYGSAVASAPNDVRVHYRYTYALLIDHQNKEALAAAEDTVTADPFSSDAWAIRGLALAANDRYPEAIASGLQALALDAKNPRALAFVAQTYLDANQPSAAQEKVQQALEADPNSAEAQYASGLINYNSTYDFTAALNDFQAAHDAAPNLPQITVDLAWTNWQLANYDQGVEELQSVIESNPDNLDALYALGFFEYQVYGNPNKSHEYLNRCVQADPNNIPCLNYLATVQLGLNNPNDAAKSYQRIIDIGTDNPVYYLRAGRTYANLNQCNSAVPLLRKGYALEQQQSTPDVERLAAFESFLTQCNAPFNPVGGQAAATSEPLLVPLGSGG